MKLENHLLATTIIIISSKAIQRSILNGHWKLGVEIWRGLFIEFPSISLQNNYSLKRVKWEPNSGETCEASHNKMIKVNIISKCMNLICAVWREVLRKLESHFSNIPAKSVKPNSKFVWNIRPTHNERHPIR